MHAKKPTGEWLESLGADWLLPEGAELILPDGSTIPTDFQVLDAPDGWARESEDYSVRWVTPGEKREGLVSRNLSPSSAETIADSVAGDVVELGERMVLENVNDVTALGQALHSLIAAEINSPDDAE